MDRKTMIVDLKAAASLLQDKEHALMVAALELQVAKDGLQAAEDRMILGGEIDGKNAEIRAAQLREKTANERLRLQEAERAYEVAKLDAMEARNRLGVLKVIAGLLSGAGSEVA